MIKAARTWRVKGWKAMAVNSILCKFFSEGHLSTLVLDSKWESQVESGLKIRETQQNFVKTQGTQERNFPFSKIARIWGVMPHQEQRETKK